MRKVKLRSENVPHSDKTAAYLLVLDQLKHLTEDETDVVANQANVAALLHQSFPFFWVGFYLVKGQSLVVGPYQGPVACTRIGYGKGVCGKAWETKKTIIVPDVHQFPGHIACSTLTQSEIVVPVVCDNQVVAVLDVDSDQPDSFDDTDQKYLEEVARLVGAFMQPNLSGN